MQHSIVMIDKTTARASDFKQGRYTRRLPPSGMVNVSISSALAIGERVGKAGPDLFRSPMMRCSHARFPRCESYGARAPRRLESKGYRNHTCRSSGADRDGVRL